MSSLPTSAQGGRNLRHNSYTDIDIYGRGFDGVFGAGAEEAGRHSTLLKLKETQDARSAIRDGSFIEYDVYGRGDPRIFGPNAHLVNAAQAKGNMPHSRKADKKKKSLRVFLYPVREKITNVHRRISDRFSSKKKNRNRTPGEHPTSFESNRANPITEQNRSVPVKKKLPTAPEGRVAQLAKMVDSVGVDAVSPRRIPLSPSPIATRPYQAERLLKSGRAQTRSPRVSGVRHSVASSAQDSNDFSKQSYGTAGIMSVETVSIRGTSTGIASPDLSTSDSHEIDENQELQNTATSSRSSSSTSSRSSISNSQDSDESNFSQEVTIVQMAEAVDEINSDEDVDITLGGSPDMDLTASEKIVPGCRTVQEIINDLDVTDGSNSGFNTCFSGTVSEDGSTSSVLDDSDSDLTNEESDPDNGSNSTTKQELDSSISKDNANSVHLSRSKSSAAISSRSASRAEVSGSHLGVNSGSGSDKSSKMEEQIEVTATIENTSDEQVHLSQSSRPKSTGSSFSAVEVQNSDLGLERGEPHRRYNESLGLDCSDNRESSVVLRASLSTSSRSLSGEGISSLMETSDSNLVSDERDSSNKNDSFKIGLVPEILNSSGNSSKAIGSEEGALHSLSKDSIGAISAERKGSDTSASQNGNSSFVAESSRTISYHNENDTNEELVVHDDDDNERDSDGEESLDLFYDALDSIIDSDNSMEAPSSSVVMSSSENSRPDSDQTVSSASTSKKLSDTSGSSHYSQVESTEVDEDDDSDLFLPALATASE